MSYQFTERGKILQECLNSENWTPMHRIFECFFHLYKGYDLDKKSIYHGLLNDFQLDFYNDKIMLFSGSQTKKDYREWFLKWLKLYDDIVLTEKDKSAINKIVFELT